MEIVHAAGIPGKIRIFYFPCFLFSKIVIKELEPEIVYRAFLFNPLDGSEYTLGNIGADPDGKWIFQEGYDATGRIVFPFFQDWVLVMVNDKEYS